MRAYKFYQAVRINGQLFGLGVHQVSEAVEEHVDFLHFAKCGWITEAPNQPPPPAAALVSEEAARLAKRLEEKAAAKKRKADEEAKKADCVREQEKKHEAQTVDFNEGLTGEVTGEDVGNEDQVDEEIPEEHLTPQQKAARTRKAKKAKTEA